MSAVIGALVMRNNELGLVLPDSKFPSVEPASLMIAANAEVNAVDENGATALHYASDMWNVELVKCLLEYGADPMLKDKAGVAPLHATLFQHKRFTYQALSSLLANDDRVGGGNQQNPSMSVMDILGVYAKATRTWCFLLLFCFVGALFVRNTGKKLLSAT